MTFPAIALTAISGGINRLRTKGGADKNSLFDLLNGYVTQAGTVKVREGTYRNANIAAYSGVGTTKGLLAYQNKLHVFGNAVVPVPPGYALHVLNYPASAQNWTSITTPGTFAASTRIGANANYGLVSSTVGFAVAAIATPTPLTDIGSVVPNTFLGATIDGLFQTLASSPSDPNQVYLILSGSPAMPAGAAIAYTNNLGGTTTVTLGATTNVLGLGSGYAVYALGTVSPDFETFTNVSLLLHFDGSFTDSSSNANVVTANDGANISTLHPQFGSGYFENGNVAHNDNYISTPIVANGPLDLSTGDFTVEFSIYPVAVPPANIAPLMSASSNSSGVTGWNIVRAGSGGGGVISAGFGGFGGTLQTPAATLNTWNAIAFVRKGNLFDIFLNGVSSGSPATFAGSIGSTGPLYIGAAPAWAGSAFFGGFDEVRITKGQAHYTPGVNYTPRVSAFTSSSAPALQLISSVPYPIKEIHFAAPYLGGIYVVAEFSVPAQVEAASGSVFHYWIQSSSGGDNANAWQANTNYTIGNVVIPTTPNGLTYIASRRNPANPVWQSNISEAVNNIIEPTVANGFKYTATATLGTNPTTGLTEPTWPTSDGATVNENSSIASDQTVLRAVPAPTTPPTTPPTRYNGGIAGGFKI